jgi:hypothetical protein
LLGEPPTIAKRGQSLKEFVTEALRDTLMPDSGRAGEPEWMQSFGKLKRLHKVTSRVQSIIDQEFEVIESEDRRGKAANGQSSPVIPSAPGCYRPFDGEAPSRT